MIGAGLGGQSKVGGQEGGAKLGDKLFHGVAFIAEALSPEVAVEAGGVAGPVGAFMRKRGVIAFRVAERLKRRHLHVIVRHAADSDDRGHGFRRSRPWIPIERGHAFRSKAATCSEEGGRGVVVGMVS